VSEGFKRNLQRARDNNDPQPREFMELYKFYFDIAAGAWPLHNKWKTRQGFAATRQRSIVWEGNTIVEVSDGNYISHPSLSAWQ
jgi:hypothetical protein